MAKEVDLLSYWMPVLKKLREFREIAKTEEPELVYILEAIDRTLRNTFIEDADEYGIKRLEKMMKIYPNEGDSLETRKFNIMVKWNDTVPYTDDELEKRLISLCGSEDAFEIVRRYTEYCIDITTHLGVAGSFDAVTDLLLDIIPCNMVLTLKNILEESKLTPFYLGVATCTAMGYQITNDINPKDLSIGYMYYGVGISEADTHVITHDISSKVSESSNINTALVGSIGSSTEITHDVALNDSLSGELREAVGIGVANTQIITHDLESKADITGNSTVASPVNSATVITIN